MTAFAGVVSLDGAAFDRGLEDRLAAATAGTGSTQIERRRSDGAVFVQRRAAVHQKAENRLRTGRDGKALFVGQAYLDNREEMGRSLGLSPDELRQTHDGDLVCAAFERWGERGVAQCLGAFAFAYWDAGTRSLTLCRDYMGKRAVFFHRAGNRIYFASAMPRLLALPGVPRELDPVQLANRLAVNYRERWHTLYRGVDRVPSRSMMTFSPSGAHHTFYWTPAVNGPAPYRREQDYVERARELFDQAVATAIAGQSHLAVTASGGLDSSAIVATAARLGTTDRITCYTLLAAEDIAAPPDQTKYRSERDKLLALQRMYPQIELRLLEEDLAHRHIGDDHRLFSRIGQVIHGPSNSGWYLPLYDAIRADRHDIAQFGTRGNVGLSWDGPSWLLVLLKTGQFGRFLHEARETGRLTGRGTARTILSDAVYRGLPEFVREPFGRLIGRGRDRIEHFSALNPGFIAQANLNELWSEGGFHPWYRRSAWDPAGHRAYAMFDHYQAARDDNAAYFENHGFDFRDAHADRRLLEFLLTVPEPLYRQNGVPRAFARTVLADRLPPQILNERRRGEQGGAWFRRLNPQRQAMAADIKGFESSPLIRTLLDVPRMKRLIEEWPADELAAQARESEYRYLLTRGVHMGRFIRWVEGGNA